MVILRTLPLKFLIALLVTCSFPLLFSLLSIFFTLPDFTGEFYLLYLIYGGAFVGTYGVLISLLAEALSFYVQQNSRWFAPIIKLAVYLAGGSIGGLEGILIALLFFLYEAIHSSWYSSSPHSFVLFAVLLPLFTFGAGIVITIGSIQTH